MNKQAAHIFIPLIILVSSCSLFGVDPEPVSNADAIGGIITLNASGNYRAIEDLVYPVVISASNVTLNMNRHKVSHNDSNDNIITVTTNLYNITVFNGRIHNTDVLTSENGSGVLVSQGASRVYLENLTIVNCGNGVYCAGVWGQEVVACRMISLDCVACTQAWTLHYANQTTIKNCRALNSKKTGFDLLQSQANCLYNCQALKTIGTTTALGFKSDSGQCNLFDHCIAQETKTSSTTFGDKACGFLLTGTETKTKLLDCTVDGTDVLGTPNAITTSGVELQPVLVPNALLLSEIIRITGYNFANIRTVSWAPVDGYRALVASNNNVALVHQFDGITDSFIANSLSVASPLSCAWSPDGKYIAVSCAADPEVVVYLFKGPELLVYVDSDSIPTAPSYCVAWSPNGKFLAVNDATGGGSGGLRMYSFDGTTLTHISSAQFVTAAGAGYVFSWSADGTYIIVGPRDGQLIAIPVSAAGAFGPQVSVVSGVMTGVACSPRGRYVATADTSGELTVWSWTGITLTSLASVAAGAETVVWSPCGNYVAVGTMSTGLIRLYQFDGSSLTWLKDLAIPVGGANEIFALAWSPDGQYITAARMDAIDSGQVIVRAMYSPSNCLIDNCSVVATHAVNQNIGRGVVAGGSNVLTRNVSAGNGVNFSYGISNVYDGQFDLSPARNVVQPFDNISKPSA